VKPDTDVCRYAEILSETWLAVVGETSTIMLVATLQSNRKPEGLCDLRV
jgi:hypothetical protein